jgi:hypothetical protein
MIQEISMHKVNPNFSGNNVFQRFNIMSLTDSDQFVNFSVKGFVSHGTCVIEELSLVLDNGAGFMDVTGSVPLKAFFMQFGASLLKTRLSTDYGISFGEVKI